GKNCHELLFLAASAEKNSEHPLGVAIVRAANEKGVHLESPDEFEALPGYGIRAALNGKEVLIGNDRMMAEKGVDVKSFMGRAEKLSASGKTPIFLAVNKRVAGIIAVADILKDHSKEA